VTGRRPRWARLLAPVALVATVFALFTIVTSGSGGDGTNGGGDGGSPAKATATATAAGGKAKPAARTTGAKTYRVKPGDTPSSIAEDTDVPLETLLDLNPTVDPQALSPGQKLKLRP